MPGGGGGVLPNKEVGGMDLTSSLKAKFGARSNQVHQIRGKIWELLSPQEAKIGEKFVDVDVDVRIIVIITMLMFGLFFFLYMVLCQQYYYQQE